MPPKDGFNNTHTGNSLPKMFYDGCIKLYKTKNIHFLSILTYDFIKQLLENNKACREIH